MNKDRCVCHSGAKAEDNANLYWNRGFYVLLVLVMKKLEDTGRSKPGREAGWGLVLKGFPGSSAGKESDCNAGDLGSILGSGRSPGEGMATHSSNLAWRIPGTGEPGCLPSMGSH